MNAIVSQSCNSAITQNDKAVIEFRICKQWRQAGRAWTDAELETAIQGELDRLTARRRAELEQKLCNGDGKPKQLQLIDIGRNAAETRAEAIKQLDSKGSIKRATLDSLMRAGRYGRTRFELAKEIGCQQSSLCSTVLELINSGDVTETAERRESGVGGRGCVLVLSSYRGPT